MAGVVTDSVLLGAKIDLGFEYSQNTKRLMRIHNRDTKRVTPTIKSAKTKI